MTRLTRINTIWRKELLDTLRDRRTLIAMVLVPLVLYPAMMLGSLQGFELQVSRLSKEEYKVAVNSPEAARWLRWLLDTDAARRPDSAGAPAEELVAKAERGELKSGDEATSQPEPRSREEQARATARRRPPEYTIDVLPTFDDIRRAVLSGAVHVGVLVTGPLPSKDRDDSAPLTLIYDQTDVRSAQFATPGLQAVLERYAHTLVLERLTRVGAKPEFIEPIRLESDSVATPERVGGSILGQIVPLILVVMTITGAIYPAIDLTAGERERGTLETLMVAPVPTVDLIAGKFVVVTLIALLSAGLNLLSIGGTIWMGGLGNLLNRGGEVVIPLTALPWVLMVLVPLAVMFSAALLAVCSFARSFKEAQNYVMPVMMAALIPAVVGVLPGTRLDGPLLIMPVTNIVILTRDLFTGRTDISAITWVMLSTTLYAGAAVAVAAKLFGQEAVLFADSGSIKTLFQRRFFRAADRPTAAQAFLLLAVVYSLNFFVQQSLGKTSLVGSSVYFFVLAGLIVVFFAAAPLLTAAYLRVRIAPAFRLAAAPAAGWGAALLFGLSTWVLAQGWFAWQKTWLPIPREYLESLEHIEALINQMPPALAVLLLAVVPAICEELFFRGYALSGLRGGIGPVAAACVTGLAFGVYHGSIHRLIITAVLGVLFAMLVLRFRSIWPAMLAHVLHNGISLLSARADGLAPVLRQLGYDAAAEGAPPAAWLGGAVALTALGIVLCVYAGRGDAEDRAAALSAAGASA